MNSSDYDVDHCHPEVSTLGYDLVRLLQHDKHPDLFFSERLGTYSTYQEAINNMPEDHDDYTYSVYRG